MKRAFLGAVILAATVVAAAQTVPESTVKIRGCIQGDGSDEKPWLLAGVIFPAPAAPQGRGGAPAGGRGAAAGGRGAAAPPAPALPAPAAPAPVDLRLTGVNMSLWRGMRVEVEGSLGSPLVGGLQEFRVTSARSAWGDCPLRK